MLLPALGVWLIIAGYGMARSAVRDERVRGYAVFAAAEICLLIFGFACIFVEPTAAPSASTLFPRIVSFVEFPLLVLAIVMLALGWRPTRAARIGSATPPTASRLK